MRHNKDEELTALRSKAKEGKAYGALRQECGREKWCVDRILPPPMGVCGSMLSEL